MENLRLLYTALYNNVPESKNSLLLKCDHERGARLSTFCRSRPPQRSIQSIAGFVAEHAQWNDKLWFYIHSCSSPTLLRRHPSLITLRSAFDDPSGGRRLTQSHNLIHKPFILTLFHQIHGSHSFIQGQETETDSI